MYILQMKSIQHFEELNNPVQFMIFKQEQKPDICHSSYLIQTNEKK
jgi:hypothetical protein